MLHAYDTQLRNNEGEVLPAGVMREGDGPLFRLFGFSAGWGFVGYRDLAGIEGPALDELIARQVDFFARRGERFEWKFHGHDRPPDLAANNTPEKGWARARFALPERLATASNY